MHIVGHCLSMDFKLVFVAGTPAQEPWCQAQSNTDQVPGWGWGGNYSTGARSGGNRSSVGL